MEQDKLKLAHKTGFALGVNHSSKIIDNTLYELLKRKQDEIPRMEVIQILNKISKELMNHEDNN